MAKLFSFNRRRALLNLLRSLTLNIVQLFGCFIVDVPTAKLMGYMREPLELFMMTTSQLLINYLPWPFCIHHQNIQKFLIEVYQVIHDLSRNSLKRESTISLQSKPGLVIPSVNTVLKKKNFLRYFGSVIWNSLLIEIREDHLISSFVKKI